MKHQKRSQVSCLFTSIAITLFVVYHFNGSPSRFICKLDVSNAAEISEDKLANDSQSTTEHSAPVVNGEKCAEGTSDVHKDQVDQNFQGSDKIPATCNPQSNPEEKTDTSIKTDNLKPVVNEDQTKLAVPEKWSFEEIEKLLNFVSKVNKRSPVP